MTREQKHQRAELKHKHTSEGQRQLAATVPFAETSADLKYMGTVSLEGGLWLVTIICRRTKLSACFGIARKSDFKDTYRHFLEYVKNQYGTYPRIFLTDNGKEFVNKAVESTNLELGVSKESTAPHVSVQNSVAERFQRTCGEAINAMLYQGCLPPDFWQQVLMTFVFIKNRLPSKTLYDQAPMQLTSSGISYDVTAELDSLHVPGCYAVAYLHGAAKMSNKGVPCIYLGPAVGAMSGQKGHRLYRIDGPSLPLKASRVLVTNSFRTDETVFPGKRLFGHLLDFKPIDYSCSEDVDPAVVFPCLPGDASLSPSSADLAQVAAPSVPAPVSPPPSQRTLSSEFSPIPFGAPCDPIFADVDLDLFSDNPSAIDSLPIPSPAVDSPAPEKEYEIESILGRVKGTRKGPDKGKWLYKVRFKGYPEVSTIPERNFVDKDMLNDFKTRFTKAKDRQLSSIPEEPVLDSVDFAASSPVPAGNDDAGADVSASSCQSPGGESSSVDAEVTTAPGATGVASFSDFSSLPCDASGSSSALLGTVATFVNLLVFCQIARIVRTYPLIGLQVVAAFSSGVSYADDGQQRPDWRFVKVPKSHGQVMMSPQRDLWFAAEKAELDAIAENRTWTCVPKWKVKEKGKTPISLSWVYKLKPPTSLQQEPIYKARLVAHGYRQTLHVDYEQTFAQVATMKAFRVLLWVSSLLGLLCTQMDVSNAFLSADIDTEVYVLYPPGYTGNGYLKLNKCLYGLKQSPRLFYKTLVKTLLSAGLQPLVTDSCVFKFREGTRVCFVLIFVDDIIIAANCEDLRKKVEKALSDRFKMKNLGELKHFVGIRVQHTAQGIKISQSEYIEKILEHFRIGSCNEAKLPQPSSVKLSSRTGSPRDKSERLAMSKLPYRQLIGSLLYLFGTIPEICFCVILLSSFVSDPGFSHWNAALYVLKYLKRVMHNQLIFLPNQTPVITAFSDSDWGNNVDHRRSVSGYIIYLGTTPIVWKSKYQKGAQALSSCEAEYRAMVACCKDLRWLAQHLSELGIFFTTPINLYCDNEAAIALAANPVNHDRTKHIDIEYHVLRTYIDEGFIRTCSVDSKNNPADLFTKSVNLNTFSSLINAVYKLPECYQ